ncbi:hypothetical protein BKA69DRAFT_1128267 [Paraphysoderma sedebokerense]|nr:hypothetical protein BKA69DRAFT_1128267 [Paraphysoderma sedebokerense]
MFNKIVIFALLALVSTISALPQNGSGRPQIESLGNGCFKVTLNSGGGSSTSTVCGEGTPTVTDDGNGCFTVRLGGSTSSSCASSGGAAPNIPDFPGFPNAPEFSGTPNGPPNFPRIPKGFPNFNDFPKFPNVNGAASFDNDEN